MASTSSSYSGKWKYDVFLSFRGEIRNDFLSHLYYALRRNRVNTFIDEKLDKGKDLQVLLQAIEESAISIIIFSEDFAGSTWCLDEVVKIVECMNTLGQVVLRVFLRIDPSVVTDNGKAYAIAIDQHEKKAKEEMEEETIEKVPRWREALPVAASQSGWDSNVTGPEAWLVEQIVEEVVLKLENMSSIGQSNLIGFKPRFQRVSSLLCINSENVRIIGIWGMGGMGKTTIAKSVFAQFSKKFDASYFLENVGIKTEKNQLNHVLKELYSRILAVDASSLDLKNKFVRNRLSHKKVLIVLDDVRNSFVLGELLLGGRESFGSGSKIIVTSRHLEVIQSATDETYNVEKLSDNESLQLFSLYAFKQNETPFCRLQQSKQLLNYCKGNPLAISVMGSALFGKDDREWQSAIDGFRTSHSNPQIKDLLQTCYNELSLDERNIFLDIACFFRGWGRDDVIEILDGSYSSAYFKTSILISKSLINISDNKLEMHDLLQEMGWNIVLGESNIPGRRSRLWNLDDIYNVLAKKKGTEAIEAIFLDASKIKHLHLQADAFVGMDRLKMLRITQSNLLKREIFPRSCHISFLGDELRYLHWDGYPFQTLPPHFNAENLVVLILTDSPAEKLWTGQQHLPSLKHVELEDCSNLSALPNLSNALNIRHVNLKCCDSLFELPPYFQHFKKLEYLTLQYCSSLEILPSKFDSKVLRYLNLESCHNIKKCPEISGKLEELYLGDTAIQELPRSITKLKLLRLLKLDYCSNLTRLQNLPPNIEELHLPAAAIKILPQMIYEQKSLKVLEVIDVSNNMKLQELPELPNFLERLYIEGTEIVIVPSSIERLSGLMDLSIHNCNTLEGLSSSISRLKQLRSLNFDCCWKLEGLPEILEPMEGMSHLTVYTCRNFKFLPENLFYLRNLVSLQLSHTVVEEIPSCIDQLHYLEWLLLEHCCELLTLPEGIHNMLSCTSISVDYCKKLRSLPELPPSLRCLTAIGCESLKTLSTSSRCSVNNMNFSKCFQLDQSARCFIADDALRLIQLMADKVLMDRCPIQITFPGSEVPKWFRDLSTGSSVTIKLPSDSPQQKGIAFCLVVGLKAVSKYVVEEDNEYSLRIRCCVKEDNKVHNDTVLRWKTDVHLSLDKIDQVVIHYIPDIEELLNGSHELEIWKNKYSGKKASFEFGNRKFSYTVKKCAVLIC